MKKYMSILFLVIISLAVVGYILLSGNSSKTQNRANKQRGIKKPEKHRQLKKDTNIQNPLCEKPIVISEPKTGPQKRIMEIKPKKYHSPADDRYDLMKDVTEADYEFMRAILTQEEKKHIWVQAIRALGFMGTEEAVEDLIYILEGENTYIYHALPAISALGFAAHTNDRAYEFLKKGCDPEFWKPRLKNWKLDHSEEIELRGLIVKSIRAIAMSGRSDAGEFIMNRAKEIDKGFLYNTEIKRSDYTSPIIDGICVWEIIQKNGYGKFKHEIYPIPFAMFQDWYKQNSQWTIWESGGPLPPLKTKESDKPSE